MKLKKITGLGLSVIMSVSMLVGCKSNDLDSTKQTIKVGMVADMGGINDESFNQSAWEGLQQAEKDLGIEIVRFKTGTPARIHGDSLDYSKMSCEYGDEKITPFSVYRFLRLPMRVP